MDQIARLEEERDGLETRLWDGSAKIEKWKAEGIKTLEFISEKEDKWILLLEEYTKVCDQIREAKAEASNQQLLSIH